jgi:hypothetical protein
VVWDVFPEQFAFEGRIHRRPRPTVHLYRHHEALGLLAVDDQGTPFKVSGAGAYLPSGDLNVACWQAGLPFLDQLRRRTVPAIGQPLDGIAVPSAVVVSKPRRRLEIVNESSSGYGG